MSDVRRTYDTLLSMYADNVMGDITPSRLRDFVATIKAHTSSSAPGSGDDANDGYNVGSFWVENGDTIYQCTDNTVGSAVWRQVYPHEGGVEFPLLIPDGTQTDPSLAFESDSNTGLARPSNDRLGLVAGGNMVVEIDSTGVITTARFVAGAGTEGNPSVYRAGDSNTGLWLKENDELGLVAGGNEILGVDTSGVTVDGDLSVTGTILGGSEITGLTNPLIANLDADGYEIQDAVIVGNQDIAYDLDLDADNLVTAGTASLSADYNVYVFDGLGSHLEIEFPNASSTIPYGMVTVLLDEGGSVSLTGDYRWEKAAPEADNPFVGAGGGSLFTIYYRYEPLTDSYAVNVTHLSDLVPSGPPSKVQVVPGSLHVTNFSNENRNTHPITYSFESSTQDGSVYVIVGFLADGNSAPNSIPGDLTAITSPPSGVGTQVQGRWYWFKPTQGNLNTGSISWSFGKDEEMAQIVVFEVSGAHDTNPIGNLASNRSSNARSSIASVPITTTVNDSLIVAALARDGNGTTDTISVNQANGFTTLTHYAGPGGQMATGMPAFIVTTREVEAADTYATPSFSTTLNVDATSQMEAFVIVPQGD